MLALTAACGSGDEDAAGNGGVSVATVTRTAGDATGPRPSTTPSPASESGTQAPETSGSPATAEQATATQAPPANGSAALTGFIYPIAGACLPQGEQLMPNAPRAYRDGIHEGVDFYGVDNCTAIGLGTPVVAVKAGRVIRIDHDYVDLTPQTLAAIRANPTSASSLDAFRGRQIWLDHGDGVVTRYCHLSGVVPGLQVNDIVAQGTTIAYVGESGTPGSVESQGSEFHLHWEVRVGDSYLGAGQDAAQVRALYTALFGP
jgi:murein DD-endopeptidase MepM/ murein hydrolase activator NlpD